MFNQQGLMGISGYRYGISLDNNGTNPLVMKDGLRYSLDDFPIDVHVPI